MRTSRALRCFPAHVAWWGRWGRRGGALEHVGRVREARWSWRQRAAATAYSAMEGGTEERGEGRSRERGRSERGRGGGVALVEASRSGGSRRWPRARRPHARRPSGVLLARGGRRWRLWWAGPAPGPWWGARYVQVRGPVAFSLSLT